MKSDKKPNAVQEAASMYIFDTSFTKTPYVRKEPPCDFGDVRKQSIDANLFPYSPQPMTEKGHWCVFAYNQNAARIHSHVSKEFAFTIARVLNARFWARFTKSTDM